MNISKGSKVLIIADPASLPNDDYKKYVGRVCTINRVAYGKVINYFIEENRSFYFYDDEIKLVENCIYNND